MNNYHHISLSFCFPKKFEKNNRIDSFFTENKILSEIQLGFQEQHSIEHAITHFVNGSLKYFDNDSYTLYVFLDLRKLPGKVNINNVLLIYLFHHQTINNSLEPL